MLSIEEYGIFQILYITKNKFTGRAFIINRITYKTLLEPVSHPPSSKGKPGPRGARTPSHFPLPHPPLGGPKPSSYIQQCYQLFVALPVCCDITSMLWHYLSVESLLVCWMITSFLCYYPFAVELPVCYDITSVLYHYQSVESLTVCCVITNLLWHYQLIGSLPVCCVFTSLL